MPPRKLCSQIVCLLLAVAFHPVAVAGEMQSSETADGIPVIASLGGDENTEREIGNTRAIRQQPNRPQNESVLGKHMALLISVNEYTQINGGLPSLQFCDNDMDRLALQLKEFDYDPIVRMSEKHDKQQSGASLAVNPLNVRGHLIRILDQLTGENDVLLIAYSGHGVQEGKIRYLCPPNTPRDYRPVLGGLIPLYVPEKNDEGKESEGRSLGILNIVEGRFIDGSFKGTCFVFLDACRNGSGSDTSTETALPKKGNIHIFSSCAPGEVSYEEEGHGRFMRHVIDAFNIKDGDVLNYYSLISQVSHAVKEFNTTVRGKQNPTPYSTSDERTGPPLLGRKKEEVFSIVPFAFRAADGLTPREIASPDGERYYTFRPVIDPAGDTGQRQAIQQQTSQLPNLSRLDSEKQNVIMDIVQLPGLNGEWWFREIPWYIPHARLALAFILSGYGVGDGVTRQSSTELFERNIYGYLNTNTHEACELLWSLLNSDESKLVLQMLQPDIMETITKLRKGLPDQSNSRATRRSGLVDILTLLKDKRENERNFFDLYTFAVLEHQIALLSDGASRTVNIDSAKRSYRTALDAHARQEDPEHPVAVLFYQLCLADYARLLATITMDGDSMDGDSNAYTETVRELTKSLNLNRSYKNSLFQIAVFTEKARNESRFGSFREASGIFREAGLRIDGSRIAKTGHPLIAHYNEQFGWVRADSWRLPQAKENFEIAFLIRQYNAWSSANPIDRMYVTYGLHAKGTISRFEGNAEEARKHFVEAREMINRIRSDISRGGLFLMESRLNEREASTLERLADLTLYHGAEANDIQQKKAVDQALIDYERGISIASEVTTRTRLIAKRTLLCLQKDGTDKFDEARKYLSEAAAAVERELENPSSNTVIPLLFFKAASIAIELREAVETKNETQFAEARTRMREFLERFHLFSRDPNGQRRDTMELRMHCAAMLLEAGIALNKNDLAGADSIYLALCLYILSEQEGIHAYLRPYYERQLRHRFLLLEEDVQQENLRSIAMGIQRMRNTSAQNDADSSSSQTILGPLLQTRGNEVFATTSSLEVANETELPENDLQHGQNDNRIFNPTRNQLVDPVTLVIFYFPDDPERNGLALILPPNGQPIEQIPLDLKRERLHIAEHTGELQTLLAEVWQRIEEEADKVVPFLSGAKGSMRQSVVISWSDESCWSKNSRERITTDMFPFKEDIRRRSNIILQ